MSSMKSVLMPRSESYRATRALPLSTTCRMPSIVTEVSATFVATIILRRGFGKNARS